MNSINKLANYHQNQPIKRWALIIIYIFQAPIVNWSQLEVQMYLDSRYNTSTRGTIPRLEVHHGGLLSRTPTTLGVRNSNNNDSFRSAQQQFLLFWTTAIVVVLKNNDCRCSDQQQLSLFRITAIVVVQYENNCCCSEQQQQRLLFGTAKNVVVVQNFKTMLVQLECLGIQNWRWGLVPWSFLFL